MPLKRGMLLRRYKRFLADVRTADGVCETIHCANTGAMRGCSDPGSPVWYSTSANPNRKYRHSLELVETVAGDRVCVNTSRANQLLREVLESGQIAQLNEYSDWVSEISIPGERGRFDFGNDQVVVEVKSVTWLRDYVGCFPDAVSERATRHAKALRNSVDRGVRAVLFFCVLHTGIDKVTIASDLDPAYGQAVSEAADNGVEFLAYKWHVSEYEYKLEKELQIELPS